MLRECFEISWLCSLSHLCLDVSFLVSVVSVLLNVAHSQPFLLVWGPANQISVENSQRLDPLAASGFASRVEEERPLSFSSCSQLCSAVFYLSAVNSGVLLFPEVSEACCFLLLSPHRPWYQAGLWLLVWPHLLVFGVHRTILSPHFIVYVFHGFGGLLSSYAVCN